MNKIIAIGLTVILILFLLIGVMEMPEFGSADNPAHNEVMERYVVFGIEETGATNVVAGMILDYRAFDTFVEATVLFTALISLFLILKKEACIDDTE